MLMMMFQQLQLYQQQSDNQYSQMLIGQHVSDCQDQQSIFEQNLGSMEDVAMSGLQLTSQISNEFENRASSSAYNELHGLYQELNALDKTAPDYPAKKAEIEAKIEAQRIEVQKLAHNATTKQSASGILMSTIGQGIKRTFQAMRNGKLAMLKTKEKRLQMQLKTLEAQGTFITKRLESVEKQLESSIKQMTPHFGVGQG